MNNKRNIKNHNNINLNEKYSKTNLAFCIGLQNPLARVTDL
jgi:hypothetical protein